MRSRSKALLLTLLALLIAQVDGAAAIHPVLISYQRSVYRATNPTIPWISWQEFVGVRADGSVAVARRHLAVLSGEQKTWFTIQLMDRARQRLVVIDQFTESTTTYPLSFFANSNFVMSSTCTGSEEQQILGFRVLRQEMTRELPRAHRRAVTRLWRSPEANCLPLRIEKMLLQADGTAGREL